MSESLPTIPPTPPAPSPASPMRSLPESLWSQSFIYAMFMLPLAAGVLIGAFLVLDKQVASTLAGTALGMLLMPSSFFFGASKHPPPTETTTTVTPPTTTTTTTGQ